MYADRVEFEPKLALRDRLVGDVYSDLGPRRRSTNNKRKFEADDKWEHDLYVDRAGPQSSKNKAGVEDLRSKLQKKNTPQFGKESRVQDPNRRLTGNVVRDTPRLLLKAKTVLETPAPLKGKRVPDPPAPPKAKPVPRTSGAPKANPAPENSKPVIKSVVSVKEAVPDTKEVLPSTSSRKKSKKKSGVDDLLKSMGLEKYSITFQVEEIDMAALRHMTEDDFRVLGIPMGPRKKILLALSTNS